MNKKFKPHADTAYSSEYGATGDGSDEFNALQSWLDCGAKRLVLDSPNRSGYVISRGLVFPSNTFIDLGGYEISNNSDSPNFWDNTTAYFGLYFGFGVNWAGSEPSRDFESAERGADRLIMSTDGLAVGDLLYLRDANVFPSSIYSIGSQVVRISAIGTREVRLEEPIGVPYTGSVSSKPQAHLLDTGDLDVNTYCAGESARMLQNTTVVGINFKQATSSNGQCAHFSTYNCRFEGVVEGAQAMGANPCSRTHFDVLFRGRRSGVEFAYGHDRITGNIHSQRISNYTGGLSKIDFRISEEGGPCQINEAHLRSHPIDGQTAESGINISTKNIHIRSARVDGSQGFGIALTDGRTDDCVIEYAEVNNPGTHGILPSSGCMILGGSITNVPVGKEAVRLIAGRVPEYIGWIKGYST